MQARCNVRAREKCQLPKPRPAVPPHGAAAVLDQIRHQEQGLLGHGILKRKRAAVLLASLPFEAPEFGGEANVLQGRHVAQEAQRRLQGLQTRLVGLRKVVGEGVGWIPN